MIRPSWETEGSYCSHGFAPYVPCSKCAAEAAREHIDNEMIRVLQKLNETLERLNERSALGT